MSRVGVCKIESDAQSSRSDQLLFLFVFIVVVIGGTEYLSYIIGTRARVNPVVRECACPGVCPQVRTHCTVAMNADVYAVGVW